ncbi:CRISPR-associated protein [Pyrobaculum sp. 3827-6]|uniref:CRISPR-associated protein n=1 Tax=Pyrobaculum sp. 3827-6 TaxID=2983604 RepID=UPI0021DA49BD|nr:CRISPR-associated protein [Pyrobaculum sp. 3827-6]MCU7786944.1 CRISPR-associated protein [Pyrobaculum sp. 3827-6]
MAILKLRVATPLFVLKGGAVVSGLDAFYKDGRLYLVDPTHPALVSRAATLEDVVKLASADPPRYAYAAYPAPPIPPNTEVKIGTAPPASTIKGVLRTAYLLAVLAKDSAVAGQFLQSVRDALQEKLHPKYVASRGEAIVFKRHLGRRTFDIFNLMRVKEGAFNANHRVYKIDVVEGGAIKTSIYAVGLAPDSVLEYEIEVRPFVKESGEKELWLTEQELKDALDTFAREVAAFERERRGYAACDRGMRLGFGAGRRWKTVLNFVEKKDPTLFGDIERYMSTKLNRVWDDKTVKTAEEKPVGWVCYEWR